MQLTKAEEQVMKFIWQLQKAYLKNIIDEYPDPKPAATTIATLLKRMIDKGFISFKQHGSNREYYPLVKKTEYFSLQMNSIIKEYFNNSAAQFASFFTTETDLSEQDLKELQKLIDEQIKNKNRSK
jgi:predicted transcriptional regulator